MKKIFTLLFALSCVVGFAEAEAPIIEDADDENVKVEQRQTFRAEEPIVEEDDCEGGKCPPQCRAYTKEYSSSYLSWKKYKVDFGIEKVYMRFPHKPQTSQGGKVFTAFSHDGIVSYSFTGYYPPIGGISPLGWFDEILLSISIYPYTCLSYEIFQTSFGDWVLDYVAHDYEQDLIIKARAIVTPFNAYTIDCWKPYGSFDDFDYFLENFWIKCDCCY